MEVTNSYFDGQTIKSKIPSFQNTYIEIMTISMSKKNNFVITL